MTGSEFKPYRPRPNLGPGEQTPRPVVALTDAEHRAMDLTAQLYNLLCRDVIGDGPSRDGDCAELAAEIHTIQHRIMAQAAARAYPDRYRLMGGQVQQP